MLRRRSFDGPGARPLEGVPRPKAAWSETETTDVGARTISASSPSPTTDVGESTMSTKPRPEAAAIVLAHIVTTKRLHKNKIKDNTLVCVAWLQNGDVDNIASRQYW